jgi:hypothetical protein
LNFLWLLSLFQDKEPRTALAVRARRSQSDMDFGEQRKKEKKNEKHIAPPELAKPFSC